MKIGIIAAMDNEFDTILNSIENKKENNICGLSFYEGTINTKEVVVAKSGIGKVNSAIIATILITSFKVDLVINSGIAGGGNGVELKDIMIANSLTYSDVDVTKFGYPLGQIPGMPLDYFADEEARNKLVDVLNKLNLKFKEGVCLTADTFRGSKSEISIPLPQTFCVEMEGASIAQTCYKLNTKFLSIRFISDVLDSKTHLADYQAFENEAAETSAKITISLLENL